MSKIPVALLAATGTVGQKCLALLEDHPTFQITELVASQKRIGQTYDDVCEWREPLPYPERIKSIKLKSHHDIEAKWVLSALPGDIALTMEKELAEKGKMVVSNASAYRMGHDVPLIIPEINSDHLALAKDQKLNGKIITNPNCTTVFICLALRPLMELAEIEHVSLATLQALSGAGYPGLSAMDFVGNVIPHIGGEEEKIEEEVVKILGAPGKVADFGVLAQVHRVPVMHGHTIALQVKFKSAVTAQQVKAKFTELSESNPELYCLYDNPLYPQPQKCLNDADQRAHIGKIKQGPTEQWISLVSMGHNLVRGAAGAALVNLEASYKFFGE